MPKPEPQPHDTAQAVRPKAFRRPPHWVSPAVPVAPVSPASTGALIVPEEPRPAPPVAPAANEPAYGLLLIAVVMLVNLLVAFALTHLDYRVGQGGTQQPAQNIAELPPAPPEVTLFAAPPEARPLTGPRRIIESADETDQITTYQRRSPVYGTILE